MDEQIPINDLATILETLADYGVVTKDVEVLTEYVRQALKRTIAAKYANERHELQVAVIQPKLEEIIAQSIQNRNWLVPGLKTRYRDQAVGFHQWDPTCGDCSKYQFRHSGIA